jgi:hypothetical protein
MSWFSSHSGSHKMYDLLGCNAVSSETDRRFVKHIVSVFMVEELAKQETK